MANIPKRDEVKTRRPDEIALDMNQRVMQIKWQDGHLSQFGFDLLRRACPCAECRPWVHGAGEPGIMPDKVRNARGDIKSHDDVAFVGSYALNIRFADGHATGIYTWPYLRSICPCPDHSARRMDSGRSSDSTA